MNYHHGRGVAVDYPRSMAAYKVAAEAGHARCQWQVGWMYYFGRGVDVDYAQARPWIEKAAAQDHPIAVCQLGLTYHEGKGVTPSWRRAREYSERAIELGNSQAVKAMQKLTECIQMVTRAEEVITPPLHDSCATSRFHAPPLTRAGRPPHGQAGGDPRHEPRRHERQARRRHRLPPDRWT